MNIRNLNHAIVELIEKNTELQSINPSSHNYADLIQQLTALRQKFMDLYGFELEEILFNVYDEFCEDNDILKPVDYVGQFPDSSEHQGVPVECDDFPGIAARLSLVANPPRFLLKGSKEHFHETVWEAKEALEA